MSKNNFLNIQNVAEGFSFFDKLPSLDEKTKKKYLAGIGFYFQEKMERNELSETELQRFFNLYPPNDNVKFPSPHLERYVKTLTKKEELPSIVISLRQFSQDFKDNYLLDFLELIAQKGTPEQIKNYTQDNKRVLNLALQEHKITQPKLLRLLLTQNPLKISKYPHYSDEQKLVLYQEHFASHPHDTSLVPSIFQDNHNVPESIRETVWNIAQEKIELYSLNPESNMFPHRDRINIGFSVEENFAAFFSNLVGHNLIYLSYCEKNHSEKFKKYLSLPQRICFVKDSMYDGETQTFYELNGYQAAFINMCKIARQTGLEKDIHIAQKFYVDYEDKLLAPILKDKDNRAKTVSYIDLLYEEKLNAPMSFLSSHNVSQEDAHSLASNTFALLYSVENQEVLEPSVLKDMVAALPVDLIKYYYEIYEKKVAKSQIKELDFEYKDFIGVFLERANLTSNLTARIEVLPKNTFKV